MAGVVRTIFFFLCLDFTCLFIFYLFLWKDFGSELIDERLNDSISLSLFDFQQFFLCLSHSFWFKSFMVFISFYCSSEFNCHSSFWLVIFFTYFGLSSLEIHPWWLSWELPSVPHSQFSSCNIHHLSNIFFFLIDFFTPT